LNFSRCHLGALRVGAINRCRIHLESGGLCSEKVTAHESVEMAKSKVKIGSILGSECANSTEPYVISRAISEVKDNPEGTHCHWMGAIEGGMPYIECKKYRKNSELNYSEIEYTFKMPADDLKIVFEKQKHVEPTRSSARISQDRHGIIDLDSSEMLTLQLRCFARNEIPM